MGKNDDDMSDDVTFKLIELVHSKKHLWQMKDKEFKDTKLKLASFRQIAGQLGYQVEIVMKRWELLKIGYRREKQRRAKEAYSGAPGPHPVPGNHAAPKDIAAPEDHGIPEDPEAPRDQDAVGGVQVEDREFPKRKITIFFDSLKFLEKMRESKETYTNLIPKGETARTSEPQSPHDSFTKSEDDLTSKNEDDVNSKDEDDTNSKYENVLSKKTYVESPETSKNDFSAETINNSSEARKNDQSQSTKNDSSHDSKNDLSKTIEKEQSSETGDDIVDLTEGYSSASDISMKENSPVKLDHTSTSNTSPRKTVSARKVVHLKKESPVKRSVSVRGNSKKPGVSRSRASPPQGSPLKLVKVESVKKEDTLISPLLKNISNQFQDTHPTTYYTPGSTKQRRSDPLEQCFMDVSAQFTNFVANQGATKTTPDTDGMFGQTIAKELQKLPEDEKNKKKYLIMKALYEA